MAEEAQSFVAAIKNVCENAAIKNVCENIDLPEDNHVKAPWPSHIYFEDVNGQSQFELVEIILNEVYKCAPIERRM